MCLYPKLIRNRKYTKTKKNGGIIPPVQDPRTIMVPIGCQKCMECKKQKARDWQVRLLEEIRTPQKAEMVTLTFSNESIQELTEVIWETDPELTGYKLDNAIATLATRRFLERWRKKYKTSVKHWLVTELGHNGTENIHLHGILWTDKKESIGNMWAYGYVHIGDYVNEETVNYITKYVMKMDEKHKEYNPKILPSPGIGEAYTKRLDAQLNTYKSGSRTREYYTTRQGFKLSLPIYYRNKIYTEEQREWLWIERLNKEERYVLGKKISIKDNTEAYYYSLEEARIKNSRLGYGNGKYNHNRTEYEEQQRWLKQQMRLGTSELINRHIIPEEVWMF